MLVRTPARAALAPVAAVADPRSAAVQAEALAAALAGGRRQPVARQEAAATPVLVARQEVAALGLAAYPAKDRPEAERTEAQGAPLRRMVGRLEEREVEREAGRPLAEARAPAHLRVLPMGAAAAVEAFLAAAMALCSFW